MAAKRNKNNKKFVISVSLGSAKVEHPNFVIDLRPAFVAAEKEFVKSTNREKCSQKKDDSKRDHHHFSLIFSKPNYRFFSWKNKRYLFNLHLWKRKRVLSLPFLHRPLPLVVLRHPFNRRNENLLDKMASLRKDFSRAVYGRRRNFRREANFWKHCFSLLLVLLFIFLPFKLLAYYRVINPENLKEKVMGDSRQGVGSLVQAAKLAAELDLKSASSEFSAAGQDFLRAENELAAIDDRLLALAALSGREDLKLASESRNFLAAGQSAAALGEHLSLAMNALFSGSEKLGDSLKTFNEESEMAEIEAEKLQNILFKIKSESLPDKYVDQFLALRDSSTRLVKVLQEITEATDKLQNFLGVSRDKRYLLVFENNAEMRGGGGFLGSYALVDFKDGKINNLEVPGGGSYDTEAGLKNFVKSPYPLRLVNARWYFWDSNWFPDWPSSAENIKWFYEKSDGPTVDGVIAFTPAVIEGLLRVVGPIDLRDQYGVVIDADNFFDVTQKIAEKDNLVKAKQLEKTAFLPADKVAALASSSASSSVLVVDNKPKKIIGDLAVKILAELPKKLNRENIGSLLSLIEESLSQKQVVFYFTNQELQQEVERRNWAGKIRETAGDYLLVTNSNIAGGKTDRKIDEKISLDSYVLANGQIVNTVRITRLHNGIKREPLYGVRNVDWLRVYVPAGSILLSARGFSAPEAYYFDNPDPTWEERPLITNGEGAGIRDRDSNMLVYQESGKTVFANWLMVDPGEEKTVEIKYLLPFRLNPPVPVDNSWLGQLKSFWQSNTGQAHSYSLVVQKQIGAKPAEFSSNLEINSSWKVAWLSFSANKALNNGWNFSGILNNDLYFGAALLANN